MKMPERKDWLKSNKHPLSGNAFGNMFGLHEPMYGYGAGKN